MKKLSIVLLILALCCSLLLTGCGKKDSTGTESGGNTSTESTDTAGSNESSYNLDFTSTEVQTMSTERAPRETLGEAFYEWLNSITYFPDGTENSDLTYDDFVDHIGFDATEYYYDDSRTARVYTWRAEGEDGSQLGVWFVEEGGSWNLSMLGAMNVS